MSDPAFPTERWARHLDKYTYTGGLTKRELLAAMAMQALISNDRYWDGASDYSEATAVDAVRYADALLEELAR